jgi:hypothetical protein
MALNSPFSVRIEKNSVDDLDKEMGERRRSIEDALADFRAKHRHARRPNWSAWVPDPSKRKAFNGSIRRVSASHP